MLENLYWIIIEDSLIVDNTIIIIYILQALNGKLEHFQESTMKIDSHSRMLTEV